MSDKTGYTDGVIQQSKNPPTFTRTGNSMADQNCSGLHRTFLDKDVNVPKQSATLTQRSFGRFVITLGMLMMLAMAGCQPPQEEASTGGDGPLRIAVIPKGTTHIFWESVHHGADQAAAELGDVEVIWKGTAKESDRDQQITIVQGFANKDVDAICLAPLDSVALAKPVEQASSSGVPVIVFDSGLEGPKENFVSYVATDNFRAGQLAGERMLELLDGKGNVILVRYTSGSESTTQREEGFLDVMRAAEGITILSDNQYCGTTVSSTTTKAQQLINKFGDKLDGIFAVCEPNAEGVLQALTESGIAEKVKFVGMDPSDQLRAALEDGRLDGLVLQDPVQMGYMAVKTAVAHVRGESVEDVVDTGVFLATPENRNSEEIQRLLNPK
ncbi:MAG: substrate-binding domain-containing protein, partial [Planctomycetota bacterium]